MTTVPNMATITASLQNCSLSNHHQRGDTSNNTDIAPPDGGDVFSDSSENTNININNNNNNNNSDGATLELNSEISLPYHWEQCLDLKTGEIYFINWMTGMRMNEDPRINVIEEEVYVDDNLYYSEEEEDDDDDEESYDSEESSLEEEVSSARVQQTPQIPQINIMTTESARRAAPASAATAPTLVLGGCKRCMMYFMVAKENDNCPKCGGQRLYFDS